MAETKSMLGFRIEESKISLLEEIARARSLRVFGREGEIDKTQLCRQAILEFIDRQRPLEPTLATMPD